jgi:hypothetical protein
MPDVVRMEGTATWTVDAMDALREQSPEMATELDGELERGFHELKKALPLPPDYGPVVVEATSTASVSGANRVHEALVSVRAADPRETSKVMLMVRRYAGLQEEQGRAEEAARRVKELFPEQSARFAEALNAARVAQGSPSRFSEETAAMVMRTFLAKLKGELFERARGYERENMTWPLMAERLSIESGRHVLAEQDAVHSGLNAWLTDIGKARSSAFSFPESCARFIDHVYVVCGEVLAASKAGQP